MLNMYKLTILMIDMSLLNTDMPKSKAMHFSRQETKKVGFEMSYTNKHT